MKIIRFRAKKVHNTYDFDFKFHHDISFLVGINGSGKTTALRLIQASMTLDFLTLYSIKFHSIEIDIEILGKIQSIKIQNEGSRLKIIVNGVHADVNIPILEDEERNLYAKSGKLEDYIEDQRLRFISQAGVDIQKMLKWPRPLFLGLERRTGRYDDESAYFEEEADAHVYRSIRRSHRGFVEGLENCQRLLETAYKTYRRISDSATKRLTNVIVESTFEYIEFKPNTFDILSDDESIQELINRRNEIEMVADSLGGGQQAAKQINIFFQKIKEVATHTPIAPEKRAIELMLNRAQLQLIQKLLAEIDKQKKVAERYYEPISDFIELLNKFFRESKKIAQVDSLGRLNIMQNGAPINLAWLSSGEKQLIILLTHARFSRPDEGVIIVDEPELSLHLRWQEMLIDSLSPPNAGIQFIFATHSPEIVGYKRNNCITVG